jgi:DNA polymerase-3 subunit gamma/tau
VDRSRLTDPEIAAESDRPRLEALASQFSREDLLRAFDLLARAEADMKGASQPQYHLEMALLRWMHLRRLVPIEDLIAQMEGGTPPRTPRVPEPDRPGSTRGTLADRVRSVQGAASPTPPAPRPAMTPQGSGAPIAAARPAPEAASPAPPAGDVRQAFLAEIQKGKPTLYGMVVAQALRIEVGADAITFVFSATHRMLREQLEQHRPWLEQLAARITGRKMAVLSAQADAPPALESATPESPRDTTAPDLKAEALANPGVQALLEMFPAEIRDVEEL